MISSGILLEIKEPVLRKLAMCSACLRRNLGLIRATRAGTGTNSPEKAKTCSTLQVPPGCRGSTRHGEQSNHCSIASQELALRVAKVIAILAGLR